MKNILGFILLFTLSAPLFSQSKLELTDIFNLEYVSDPQISPDGSKIIYTRNFKDIMTDRNLSNLWMINFDGTMNRPLTTGNQNDFAAVWSPNGKEVVYKSNKGGSVQLYRFWLDTRSESKLTNLQSSPGSVSWSRSGKWLAFSMFVPEDAKPLVQLPAKPKGAKWNDPPKYIDDMKYRADGAGYLQSGARQLFVLSIEGGTAQQITSGDFDFGNPVWGSNDSYLYTSVNMHEDKEYNPRNSEIVQVSVQTGAVTELTARRGPDTAPVISPDGKTIAYTGMFDRFLGYQLSKLYVMDLDGKNSREVITGLDRSIGDVNWSDDGKSLYFMYEDQGDIKVSNVTLTGKTTEVVSHVSGLSLGRPYAGGQYSLASNGNIAYTYGSSEYPAELGAAGKKGNAKLTDVNSDLLNRKAIGKVEEVWYESSFDKQKIQGWICYPPNFDKTKKYPLILEIHGGPFASYGPWFSIEVQLYAAAGYVVLYTNPRGSTSYGEDFANLIHHNYPNQDYDDLMTGVDVVIDKGFIDTNQLYVTGGSGGGVLTAWIVGHTDRFKAAVVAKPVINWYSFVLYSDNPATFYQYWFPGLPWDNLEHYMKRSPLSYVGNVTTPTMLLTGESDFRTPIAESEQYYAALKLNKVETAMVRIPGASHGIANQPSNLVAKVAYILGWFEKYK
ncbi:MAG: S9 family peptidase [Cyclobacteriaceae bacterium]|nr:S9 family peptidase [Cyclobacteriaceae bacterium]